MDPIIWSLADCKKQRALTNDASPLRRGDLVSSFENVTFPSSSGVVHSGWARSLSGGGSRGGRHSAASASAAATRRRETRRAATTRDPG